MPTVAKPLQPAQAQYAPAVGSASFSITHSDTNQLAQTTRKLYVGITGDVTLQLAGDSASVLFKAMPVGLYDLAVKQVFATGTTASDLVGLT